MRDLGDWQLVDLVWRRHGGKLNRSDRGPTFEQGSTEAMTAVHESPVIVEDDREFRGRLIDSSTVLHDLAESWTGVV